jgi:hypothetical protein
MHELARWHGMGGGSMGEKGELGFVCGDQRKEKVYFTPQSMGVGTHHPPTYENGFFYPLNFLKRDKSPPEAILKNHSKSQKNHKMEN